MKKNKVSMYLIILGVLGFLIYGFFSNQKVASEVVIYEGVGSDWEISSKLTSIDKDRYNHELIIEYTGHEEEVLIKNWYLNASEIGTGGGDIELNQDKIIEQVQEVRINLSLVEEQNFKINWNNKEEDIVLTKK